MESDDPRAKRIREALQRAFLGRWCTIRPDPEGDVEQTCKLCGATDWFTPPPHGQTPARACPECGLEDDPGDAALWFDFVRRNRQFYTGYNEKPDAPVVVRCRACAEEMTYSYRDGPPLACPRCG